MSELLAESEYTSTIDAPIEALDLTEWVFTLADDEYQRCATAHIAAGASTDQVGKRVSINVEKVGNLIISHYNEDVSEKDHCRVVSTSDVLTAQGGRTKFVRAAGRPSSCGTRPRNCSRTSRSPLQAPR